MFASSLQFQKLAFGNFFNTLYSSLLLLVILLLVLRFLQAHQAQGRWEELWQDFTQNFGKQFDQIIQISETNQLIKELPSIWLEDLGGRVRSDLPLLEPEEQMDLLLEHAMKEHPLLTWEVESSSTRWQQLSGVSVLLGLLGTFFGLTSALTQLPFQGGLKELTGGLQQVLPMMGVAFWTSVCGLLASLAIRLTNTLIEKLRQERLEAWENFKKNFARRLLMELYPSLRKDKLGTMTRNEPSDVAPALTKKDLEEVLQNTLMTSLSKMLQNLDVIVQKIDKLSFAEATFEPLRLEMTKTTQALISWQSELEKSRSSLDKFIQTNSEALEPISQTERLLSERISALTRQHQALGETLLKLEQFQNSLPQTLFQLIKKSLIPAYGVLQRGSLHLGQLLEQHIEKQRQERLEWREQFERFNDKFEHLTQLQHHLENTNRELARIAENLLEISSRISFHPEIANDDQNNSEELEKEINRLLDGIDFSVEPTPKKDT